MTVIRGVTYESGGGNVFTVHSLVTKSRMNSGREMSNTSLTNEGMGDLHRLKLAKKQAPTATLTFP
jgi:hypothetical protein